MGPPEFVRLRSERFVLPTVLLIAVAALGQGPDGPAARASEILRVSGVRGGLAVMVGGDAALAAGLTKGRMHLVDAHLLAEPRLETFRRAVRTRKLEGRISANLLTGAKLPHASGIVNLLVVADETALPKRRLSAEEIARVVAPGGVACVAVVGEGAEHAEALAKAFGARPVKPVRRWAVLRRPRPKDMDEWTHYDHGPDGNRVSRDKVIAPPSCLQWIDRPTLARGHYSHPSGWVSAGGRVFYVYDDIGPAEGVPMRLALSARDAFNGLLLWKRPVTLSIRRRYNAPAFYPRALVATAHRVYVVLDSAKGPLLALDAATGKTIRRYDSGATEILLVNGALILAGGGPIRSVDPDTGRSLWKSNVSGRDLACDGRIVCLDAGKQIVCLDAATGKARWKRPLDGRKVACIYGNRVFVGGYGKTRKQKVLYALRPKDGHVAWQRQFSDIAGYNLLTGSPTEVFGADGLMWALTADKSPTWIGMDPTDGQIRRRIAYPLGSVPFKLRRCSENMATERHFLTGPGVDLLALADGQHTRSRAVRSACHWGLGLANGLMYAFPVDCGCFSMVRGLAAVGPAGQGPTPTTRPSGPKVVKGPAEAPVDVSEAAGDWPTYRHDPQRSGAASTTIAGRLVAAWKAPVGPAPTAPVVAGGMVFVASGPAGRLEAFDAKTGRPRWRFTAGGPVDSPPTIHKGLCLLGGRDGWVYGLRADDGKQVWKLRAAPAERRIVAYGHVESAWPVHGSVLVDGGVACFAAGHASELDGGVFLYAVEPASGRLLWQEHIAQAPPSDKGGYDFRVYLRSAVKRNDLMTGDGRRCYLGHGVRRDLATGKEDRVGPRLRAGRNGLLDDNFKDRWHDGRGSGQMLVFDAARTISVIASSDLPTPNARQGFIRPGQGQYRLICSTGRRGARAAKPEQAWIVKALPVAVRAMALAGETVFIAGAPDALEPVGGKIVAIRVKDGTTLGQYDIGAPPVFDGLAAAGERLYVSTADGMLHCWAQRP